MVFRVSFVVFRVSFVVFRVSFVVFRVSFVAFYRVSFVTTPCFNRGQAVVKGLKACPMSLSQPPPGWKMVYYWSNLILVGLIKGVNTRWTDSQVNRFTETHRPWKAVNSRKLFHVNPFTGVFMWMIFHAINDFQISRTAWIDSRLPFTALSSREPVHGSVLGHSDIIRHVIMICFTGTDGKLNHMNKKCHAVDKMNDESNESVHLLLCVYVKDELVHGNTLWTMNDESIHGNTRVKDERWLSSSFTMCLSP